MVNVWVIPRRVVNCIFENSLTCVCRIEIKELNITRVQIFNYQKLIVKRLYCSLINPKFVSRLKNTKEHIETKSLIILLKFLKSSTFLCNALWKHCNATTAFYKTGVNTSSWTNCIFNSAHPLKVSYDEPRHRSQKFAKVFNIGKPTWFIIQ